jgi:geranylgeranyl transferase type-1 subunit beta
LNIRADLAVPKAYTRGGGFRGAPLYGLESNLSFAESAGEAAPIGSGGHLAMTYTALLILAILRDDFSRLDVKGIKLLLANSQQSNGR